MSKEELLMKRFMLQFEIRTCIMYFMKETDSGEASKLLIMMRDRAKQIEKINCELAHMEILQKSAKEG